jgi:hypothetical protein
MDFEDEEVIVALMDEEAVGDEVHLSILVALLTMISEEDKPSLGGFAPGHHKSNSR